MNDDERVLESFFSYYQDSKRMRAACQERMLENDDVNFIKYLYKKGETREFFDGLFYDACYTRKFKIVKFCLENGLSHIRDKTQLPTITSDKGRWSIASSHSSKHRRTNHL